MASQFNPRQPLIIALAVTLGLYLTTGVLFLTGIFKQIGLLPSVAIVVFDTLVVAVVWVLYGLGKLGPRR